MSKYPWLEGYYTNSDTRLLIHDVKADNVKMLNINGVGLEDTGGFMEMWNTKWKYGQFGPTHPEVEKITGKKVNNLLMITSNGQAED